MRFFVLLLLTLAAPLAQAQTSGSAFTEAPEARPLTEGDVSELLRLRLIEIEVLEAAEADLGPLDNDENGPVARERVEERLALEGWQYAAYQALGERVADAMGAMLMEEELAEVNADILNALDEMAAMLTPDQVAEIRAGMATHDAEAQAMIDRTRPDWPAVRAHLGTISEMDDYASGNRPTPPALSSSDG